MSAHQREAHRHVAEHRREQLIALLFERSHARAQLLGFAQHQHLVGELLALAPQLDEGVDLVPQDARIDGLRQEVDRAGFVAVEDALRAVRAGGHEDDGDAPRAFGPAHQLGELEAVHVGHLHIEDGERELVLEQQLERLVARGRRGDRQPVLAQQRLEGDEVLVDVVDQQDLDGFEGARAGAPRAVTSG